MIQGPASQASPLTNQHARKISDNFIESRTPTGDRFIRLARNRLVSTINFNIQKKIHKRRLHGN